MSLATCESSILGFAAGSAMLKTKRLQTGHVRCKRVLGSQNSDMPLQAFSSMSPWTSWLYVRSCDVVAFLVKDARSHACNSAPRGPVPCARCGLCLRAHDADVARTKSAKLQCRGLPHCPYRMLLRNPSLSTTGLSASICCQQCWAAIRRKARCDLFATDSAALGSSCRNLGPCKLQSAASARRILQDCIGSAWPVAYGITPMAPVQQATLDTELSGPHDGISKLTMRC